MFRRRLPITSAGPSRRHVTPVRRRQSPSRSDRDGIIIAPLARRLFLRRPAGLDAARAMRPVSAGHARRDFVTRGRRLHNRRAHRKPRTVLRPGARLRTDVCRRRLDGGPPGLDRSEQRTTIALSCRRVREHRVVRPRVSRRRGGGRDVKRKNAVRNVDRNATRLRNNDATPCYGLQNGCVWALTPLRLLVVSRWRCHGIRADDGLRASRFEPDVNGRRSVGRYMVSN